MRGFLNQQGTFYHCTEYGERNWVLKLVNSNDVGPAARNVSKNPPSQRLDTGIIPTPWWFTPELEQQLLAIGEDGRLPSIHGGESSSLGVGTSQDAADPIVLQLNADQLKTRLKSQLEYYFSRENLNQDRYLRSQMDSDQYVPIKTVAGFPKISQLTNDMDFIVQVLRDSPLVQVDEHGTKVRAAQRRCTLLLREIPEFTDEREVKAMFNDCPPYTSLTYGLNNSWYVTFETEAATQLAYMHLQKLGKSFNGKQICVRIKTGGAPLNDLGTHSPSWSESLANSGAVYTIVTPRGTITGVPSTATAQSAVRINVPESELSLDQLIGQLGYSVRAIFQPKDHEPPQRESVDKVQIPELNRSATTPDGERNVGPPSTEVVGSLLSAAAEANESKKRERENQQQQWKSIMENLASIPSVTGTQRITDTPFITRGPPTLKRFISQESSDIEVALDLQRQARQQKQQEQKSLQPPATSILSSITAPIQIPHQRQYNEYHHGSNTNTNTGGFNSRQQNKSYNASNSTYDSRRANGYTRPPRSSYGTDNSNRGSNNTYESKRQDGSYGNYAHSRGGGKPAADRYAHTHNATSTSSSYSYAGFDKHTPYERRPHRESTGSGRYNDRRPAHANNNIGGGNNRSHYHHTTTSQPQSLLHDDLTGNSVSLLDAVTHKQPLQSLFVHTHTQPPVLAQHQHQQQQPPPRQTTTPPTTASLTPVVVVSNHVASSSSATTPPAGTSSSDTASTTSSTRKKYNSESSEYNFMDNDFPSLVDKEQHPPKPVPPKEKAKFSAIVAGRKTSSSMSEENKKSYAQTLKKAGHPTIAEIIS